MLDGDAIQYRIEVGNRGPDPADDAVVIDFLPRNIFESAATTGLGTLFVDGSTEVVRLLEPRLASQGSLEVVIEATAPADRQVFSCQSVLVNVAQVSSPASDPNCAWSTTRSAHRLPQSRSRGRPRRCCAVPPPKACSI